MYSLTNLITGEVLYCREMDYEQALDRNRIFRKNNVMYRWIDEVSNVTTTQI